MRYRKLSNSGDFTFGGNSLDYISGAEAVAQAIKTRLLLLKGEWWEDTEDGLPLFQDILGKAGTPARIQAVDRIIMERIEGTPEVESILDFESDYENRKYSFRASVETTAGETYLEVEF